MIADEIDGAGPAKAPARGGVITPTTYRWLVGGATVAIGVPLLAALAATWAVLFPTFTPPIVWVAGAYPLGKLAMDAELRRRGLAGGGRSVEEWAPAASDPAAAAPASMVIAARPSPVVLTLMSVPFFLAGSLLFVVAVVKLVGLSAVPPPPAGGWSSSGALTLAAVGAVGFGLAGVLCLHQAVAGGPRYRLDAAGIAAGGKPVVPWSAVVAYRVATYRDPLGRATVLSRVLLGRDGRRLLTLDLAFLGPGDADRLRRALAARFPRAVKPDPGGDGW